MKDYQLYLVVATFVLIDVITMTTWQLVDPFYRATKELLPIVSGFFNIRLGKWHDEYMIIGV